MTRCGLRCAATLALLQLLPACAAGFVEAASDFPKATTKQVIAWWRWALSNREGVRPYQDPTGALCGLNQSGQFWYLAGTDGTFSAKRYCTMPADKPVLLPVIQMFVHAEPGKPIPCDEAKRLAAINNAGAVTYRVWLDDRELAHSAVHRVTMTDCFDAFQQALYVTNPEWYYPAISDGYWLILPPFAPGPHALKVEARYQNPGVERGSFSQQFSYQLNVLEPAHLPNEDGTPPSVALR